MRWEQINLRCTPQGCQHKQKIAFQFWPLLKVIFWLDIILEELFNSWPRLKIPDSYKLSYTFIEKIVSDVKFKLYEHPDNYDWDRLNLDVNETLVGYCDFFRV